MQQLTNVILTKDKRVLRKFTNKPLGDIKTLHNQTRFYPTGLFSLTRKEMCEIVMLMNGEGGTL